MSDINSNEPTRIAATPGPADKSASKSDGERTARSETPSTTPASNNTGAPVGFPVVPGYEILEEIGRGGMGVVYKARQLALNRLVALKVILAGAHADKSQLSRFYGEARAVARLRHPHIVQIYDIGEHDGLPYFSLELIEGGSLAQRIAKQPQPPAVAAHLVELLARAVHFAHTQGIIHRDLKPANILLEKDDSGSVVTAIATAPASPSSLSLPHTSLQPKITDFGLAKSLENEAQTHSSAILGTPSYMSPEQARGASANVGPATDQYALGAILYDLLTGRPPFKGTTLLDTLEQVQTREPVPPSQLQAKIPTDLETICLKCLQKDPRKRYESTLELAEDLRRFQERKPIVARPIGSVERLLRWTRRNPRVAALLGAVALLLLALAGVSWVFTLLLVREQAAVLHAKADADENARDAKEKAKLALDAKVEADENARVAAEQANLAVEALSALVGKAQMLLEDSPNSLRSRQELLQLALQLFQRVESNHRTGLADRSMAAAHKKMGEIYLLNNQKDEALRHYDKGRAITAALYEAAPSNDLAMGNYAVFLVTFGDWSQDQDKNKDQARDFYERALQLQIDALNVTGADAQLTPSEKKLSVAVTRDKLGVLLFNQENIDEAEKHFAAALALRESALTTASTNELRQQLAQSHFFHYAHAQTYRRQVYKANPSSFKARNDLAAVSARVGEMQLVKKEYLAAQKNFDENLKLRRELYEADTGNGPAQRRLSQACYMAAAAAQARDDKMAAKTGFDECVRLRRNYVKADPNDVTAHIDLMLACARAGDPTEATRIAEQEVRKRAPKDFRKIFQIACCYSLCIDAVEAEEDKAKYAAKGVEALQEARTLGHKDMKAIDAEPDLEPLRQRPEFQSFRNTLPK
jgi:serine/threonine protein kinase